jgi:hypothetical protein
MDHLVLPLFYNEILYLNPFKRIEEVTQDIIIFIYTLHFLDKRNIYTSHMHVIGQRRRLACKCITSGSQGHGT